MPYVNILLEQKKTIPFKKEQRSIQKLLKLGAEYTQEVSKAFSKASIKKLLSEVLDHYKDKNMTKNASFFNDCLLLLLRDFELCPFMASIKDCYIIYRLVTGTCASNSKPEQFQLYQLCAMLQIMADVYLTNAIDSPSKEEQRNIPDFSDRNNRAVLLLKKIEMSKGYEQYRIERLLQGTVKPPILLATKSLMNYSKS